MRFIRSSFLLSCAALLLGAFMLGGLAPAEAATAKHKTLSQHIKETVLPKPAPQAPSLNVAVDKSVSVALDAPAATVFIANPDVADVQVVTPTRIMVLGKKDGETTLMVSDDNGKILVQRTVIVTQNLSELREALHAISPDHPIKVEAVPNGVVMSGDVASASVIEEARRLAARYVPKEGGDIINRLLVRANNQIQIRVRFAEVSRDVDKRFGINWENAFNVGGFAFGLASGAEVLSTTQPTPQNIYNSQWARTALDAKVNDAMNFSHTGSRVTVNGMIDALAKDGLVTILAEPSLTAMSGETASFLAGGEFPVPVPQSQNTITIIWKQYGVSLSFTPTIVGRDRINLHVRPEVSQLTDVGAITIGEVLVPALTTRRAETTVELNSGQSFAVAGLLNNQQTNSVNKFPFLGDIPVLGPLFRSTRFQNNESELVIIITPYIVKPATQDQLGLPTDGYSPPTDADRVLRMRSTNSDPDARPLSGTPRAVKVEDPQSFDAPTPSSAPLPPVTATPSQAPTPVVAPPSAAALPISTPLPPKPMKPPAAAPAGPGGFIME